jgi:hypothetical protein
VTFGTLKMKSSVPCTRKASSSTLPSAVRLIGTSMRDCAFFCAVTMTSSNPSDATGSVPSCGVPWFAAAAASPAWASRIGRTRAGSGRLEDCTSGLREAESRGSRTSTTESGVISYTSPEPSSRRVSTSSALKLPRTACTRRPATSSKANSSRNPDCFEKALSASLVLCSGMSKNCTG